MTQELDVLFCPACARETSAETPPCVDGHGDDCPDRACLECGSALVADALIANVIVTVSARTRPRRHVA